MIIIGITLLKSILAAILAIAGVAKLIAPEETNKPRSQQSLWDKSNAFATKAVLPVFEIMIAVLLLIPTTANVAAVATTLLFGGFLTITLYNLFQEEEASCGCFGQLSQHPVSWTTAFRTFLFLTASAILAFVIPEALQLGGVILTVPIGIAVLSAVAGMILMLNEFTPITGSRSAVQSQSSMFSRRDFLKGLGAVATSILALSLHREQAAASGCCHCQYYDHFEPGCCDPYSEKKTKHYFRRCCNTCTGANGYWRKYQPDGCVYACGCYQTCDVLHGCSGGSCHCSDCGCCV